MNRKKQIRIGILFLLLGVLIPVVLEKFFITRPFSIDRMLILFFGIQFIGINIIFDRKKLWEFIYKKRYIIGIILFTYIVLMGYNTSSTYQYAQVIEPNYPVLKSEPIIGQTRSIRSDEFLVSTPTLLSQYMRNKNFATINNGLMARNTDVSFYPKLPTLSIGILTSINQIGFLFLNLDQAYAFNCFLPYFLLFFATFELLMLLTKKNKLLSLLGTLWITFSSPVLWWEHTACLAYGELATLFFYHLFQEQEKWKKVLYALLLGWAGASYIMIMYPAWQVPYGYFFLGLFIYSIIENRKSIKATDFLYLLLTIFVLCLFIIPNVMTALATIKAVMATEYPGARFITGGYGASFLYNYFASLFFTIKNPLNPCEFSQFLSFYPLPLLIGLIYSLYQKKKKKEVNSLIVILTCIGSLLSIWNYISLPSFIAKYSLISYSTPERAQLVVGVICIFILILYLNQYRENKRNVLTKLFYILMALIYCCIGLGISKKLMVDYMTTPMIIMSGLFFTLLSYCLFVHTKKSTIVFGLCIALISLFFAATTLPISKGLKVLTEKPVAKEVQSIVARDKDAIWVALDSPLYLQNYILANGARVLNSTNYYPNLELWHQFDLDGQYNEVYNRYAHVNINLTKDETNFVLNQSDTFTVNLNEEQICDLKVDYVASFKNYDLNVLQKVYGSDNIFLYKTLCS